MSLVNREKRAKGANPKERDGQRWRKRLTLSGALVFLTLLTLWFFGRRPVTPPEPEPRSASVTRAEAPSSATRVVSLAPVAAPAPRGPIIDSITLEKTEVCEGEENLVKVKAHTEDGTDGSLHVVFLGHGSGTEFPVRAVLDSRGQPVLPEVRVFGANGAATSVSIPSFRVKRCGSLRTLAVSFQKVMNTAATYHLFAQVIEPREERVSPREPFSPVRYEWRFGDGSSVTTQENRVDHEFVLRDSRQQFKSFLVEARALDARDHELLGRNTLEIRNDAFDALQTKRTVKIYTDMSPRYAEKSSDGTVHQRFHLWHRHEHAVRITGVTLTWLAEGRSEEADPTAVLGTDEIAPGTRADFDFSVSTNAHPKFIGVNIAIQGFSDDGFVATGLASLLKPSDDPTPEKHIAVSNSALTQRIVRARSLLGQGIVTQEDLNLLERQGKFQDLPPVPNEQLALQEAKDASKPGR